MQVSSDCCWHCLAGAERQTEHELVARQSAGHRKDRCARDDRLLLLHSGSKASLNEGVSCANAFRMSSASNILLIGIISLSVESTSFKLAVIFTCDNACGLFTHRKEQEIRTTLNAFWVVIVCVFMYR